MTVCGVCFVAGTFDPAQQYYCHIETPTFYTPIVSQSDYYTSVLADESARKLIAQQMLVVMRCFPLTVTIVLLRIYPAYTHTTVTPDKSAFLVKKSAPVWGRGTPLFPLVHLLPHIFPFYFSLSFIGFTYFLPLSIPSLSTRIVPLRFQAGGRRKQPNLGLVCCLCYLYSLVKMDSGV